MRPLSIPSTAAHHAGNVRVATLCAVAMRKPYARHLERAGNHIEAMNADEPYTVPVVDRIIAEINALPDPKPTRILPPVRQTRIDSFGQPASMFDLEDFLGSYDDADALENANWPKSPDAPALVMDMDDGRVVGVRCLREYSGAPFHFVAVWPDRATFDAAMAVEAEAARTDMERADWDRANDGERFDGQS